jgi:ribonucleoside-diphosphate reductase alpha chain
MDSIFEKLSEAALTLKAGCGIGYDFSSLRPKGSFVRGAGAATSGPLSFMDVYDKMCLTIMSAGGRRGAQMATNLSSLQQRSHHSLWKSANCEASS